MCIGGKEGICWLIILNSVYLNLYCHEKVTAELFVCLLVWSWVWVLWLSCTTLFSLRDRDQSLPPMMCIGGNEGICWPIVLNSVNLNLYFHLTYVPYLTWYTPLHCMYCALPDSAALDFYAVWICRQKSLWREDNKNWMNSRDFAESDFHLEMDRMQNRWKVKTFGVGIGREWFI